MKVSEFAGRARACRLSKKAKFEAAFERARRDLRLIDSASLLSSSPRPRFAQKQKSGRAIIKLPGEGVH